MNRSAAFAGSFITVCLGCVVAAPPLFSGQVDLLDPGKPETLQALAGAITTFIGVVSGLYAFRSKTPLDREQTGKVVKKALHDHNVATGADIADIKRLLSEGAGLSEAQVRRVLERFGQTLEEQSGAGDDYEARLLALADQYVKQVQAADRASNYAPDVAAKRAAAAAALRDAEFEKAEALFAEVAAIHLETGERDVLAAAAATAEQGGAARLRGRLVEAAALYGRAAELAAPFDAEAAWSWRFTQADILDDHGKLFPGPSQAESVRILRDLCLPHTPRDTRPADWAGTQNNLGNALRVFCERAGGEAGVRALNEAVEAYRTALEVRTRADMPTQWAMTQNNLGTALSAFGERAGGEAGVRALNEAVEAYRAAFEVYTRADMPAQWAMTQNNLGDALRILGERAGGEAGVRALNEAAEAFRAALEVRTRADMPAGWAMTQNNLGVALQSLGDRAGGEAGGRALHEAVEALRAALEVCTRADMPADWAQTTANLANAQGLLARLTRDPGPACQAAADMIEVIAAFEAMQAEAWVEQAQRIRAWLIETCRDLGGTCAD